MNLKIEKGYDKNIETSIRRDLFDFYEQNDSFHSFDFTLTVEWGDASRVQKYACEPLRYVLFDGEKPVGLFQGIVKKKFLVSTLQAGSTSGNGAIVYPIYGKEILKWFISKILEKHGFSSVSIFVPEYIDIPGFSIRKNYTYVIDLTIPIEKIMCKLKKSCRWSIRKAKKHNVRVEISDQDEKLKAGYMIISQAAKANNIDVPPLQWVQELHRKFKAIGHSIVALAWYEQEIVSVGYFLCYDEKMNWFLGGSVPCGYKLQAGNLVQWKVIEWGKEHGYRAYDMGGTQPHDPRYAKIDKFKSSFGGVLSTNYVLYKESLYFPLIKGIRQLMKFWFV